MIGKSPSHPLGFDIEDVTGYRERFYSEDGTQIDYVAHGDHTGVLLDNGPVVDRVVLAGSPYVVLFFHDERSGVWVRVNAPMWELLRDAPNAIPRHRARVPGAEDRSQFLNHPEEIAAYMRSAIVHALTWRQFVQIFLSLSVPEQAGALVDFVRLAPPEERADAEQMLRRLRAYWEANGIIPARREGN